MKHNMSKEKRNHLLSLANSRDLNDQKMLDNITLAMLSGEEVNLQNLKKTYSNDSNDYYYLRFKADFKDFF